MTKIFLLGFVLSLGISHSARAAEFSIADLQKAAAAALERFTSENPDHAKHLLEYTVSRKGADATVKVAVNHGSMKMDFNYLCLKVSSGIECQAQ